MLDNNQYYIRMETLKMTSTQFSLKSNQQFWRLYMQTECCDLPLCINFVNFW